MREQENRQMRGFRLMQMDRSAPPIACCYEARSLSQAERNYSTSEQELLAVIHALRTWRCYLEGDMDVQIMTDHAPTPICPPRQHCRAVRPVGLNSSALQDVVLAL